MCSEYLSECMSICNIVARILNHDLKRGFYSAVYRSVLSLCYLPDDDGLVRPTGTAITITSTTPIARPIRSPIRHAFEQNLDCPLKFQNKKE